METAIVIFVAVLIVGALIGLHFLDEYRETNRSKVITTIASRSHCRRVERDGDDIADEYKPFHLFRTASIDTLRNCLEGTWEDRRIRIFEGQHIPSRGWSSHYLFVHIDLQGAPPPNFVLRPETAGDRLGSWFGFHDINFDEHVSFSKNYSLKGEDENLVREFFLQGPIEYFSEHPGLYFESKDGHLLAMRKGRADTLTYVDEARALQQAWLDATRAVRATSTTQ